MPVVNVRPAFEDAVRKRIEWLAENAPQAWLDNFLQALEELRRELERFPDIGSPVQSDTHVVLRQRRLSGGLPYLVYYAHLREEPVREVFLTHLFHVRQRRPDIALAQWPW